MKYILLIIFLLINFNVMADDNLIRDFMFGLNNTTITVKRTCVSMSGSKTLMNFHVDYQQFWLSWHEVSLF